MVAIVTGNGLGLERSSANVLGSRGLLGSAFMGRANEGVYVNAATGNLVIQNRDEILSGKGPDAVVARTYNSLGQNNDENGDNWRQSNQRKVALTNGTVNTVGSTATRIDWDGSETVFAWDAARNAYASKEGAGAYDLLTYAGTTWSWTDGNSRVVESYDNSGANGGRITAATDTDGNAVTYTYDAAGAAGKITRITTASSGTGQINYTDLLYASNGAARDSLLSIRTSTRDTPGGAIRTQTRTSYTYDNRQRLSTVVVDLTPANTADAATYVTTYTYVGNSPATRNLVESITQTDGSRLQFGYTGGQITSITETSATGVNRLTTLAYDAATRTTTITDPLGQVTTLVHDTSNQLVKVTAPAPITGGYQQITEYAYNANGDVLSASLFDGAANYAAGTALRKEINLYDANGNLTEQQDLLGDTIRWTYGAKNEVLTRTQFTGVDPDGAGAAQPVDGLTTRYAYDSENHLRFDVSTEGRVTEYRYDAPGRVIATIDYSANLYTSGTISETELAAWVAAIADKSTSLRTDTTYDFRGNVATVTSYAKADAAGNGLTSAGNDFTQTLYTYDQTGMLLNRQIVGNSGTETYVYDGLFRRISFTDFGGFVTTTTFSDSLAQTVVTLASGLVQTSIYNLAGNLISYAESGTGYTTATTAFAYDALGRLRVVTDPVGVKSYIVYDKLGRKTANIDGDGSITEYKYDAADRLVGFVRYAAAVSAANLTVLGTATTNTEVATIRPAASAADRWNWNVYDQAGRLTQTIDAIGAVSAIQYDGASRVIQTTRYNTLLAAATVTGFQTTPPTVLTLPAAEANNDRIFRNLYDNDGLLTGTLDEEGYLTQINYDSAGRKTSTLRLANQTPASLWVSGTLGQLLASTAASAADIGNYWLYDGRGMLGAMIDGEGNVTRFHYTARGDIDQEVRGQKVTASTAYALATLPAAAGTLETTSYARNGLGQVTSLTRQLSGGSETTSYTYDSLGNVLSQTTAETVSSETRTQRFRYDLKGRLIGSLNGVGGLILVANPTNAQIDSAIAIYGTRYAYDSADRLISKIAPDGGSTVGNKTLYYYDADGQLHYEINALGEVTEYRYNVLADRTDTIVYGTRIASATLATLTGGLVVTAITNAVTAITNAALDSRSQAAYDNRGLLIAAYNPLYVASPTQSNYQTFSYNSFGQLASQSKPTDTPGANWDVQYFSYTRRGLRASVTQLLNGSSVGAIQQTFFYDAFGRLTAQRDNNTDFRTHGWGYDRAGRITSTTDYLGANTTFSYDARSNLISQTDRNGKTTTFSYDLAGRNVTTTTAEGIATSVKKNAFGQTIQITDGEGRITSYTYDKNGNLNTVTDAAGTTTNYHDTANRLVDVVDAKGVDRHYTYDAANRVLTQVADYGSGTLNLTTSTVYDAKGQQISVTDALGVVTTYAYNLKGQKVRINQDANGLAIKTDFVYRGDGKVISQTDAVGTAAQRVTTFEYDTIGRLTKKTEDAGSGKLNLVTQYFYDVNNNLVATSDSLSRTTRFVYDKESRLVFSVDAEGQVTESGYDGEGRAIWSRQYANAIAAATLAGFGNEVTAAQVTSNAAASTGDRINRSIYDGDGRIAYAVDAEGYVTRNAYDGANNVIKSWRYAAAVSVTNAATKVTLDGLVPAGDPTDAAITAYFYDGANRLTDVTNAFGKAEATTTHFVMDALGQITDTTVAFGTGDAVTTRRVFDSVGRVTSETRALGTSDAATTAYGYDALGRVTSMTDPRGFITTRTYDNLSRMLSETVPLDALTSATTSYQYDARGNRVRVTDPRGNLGYFNYDGVDRLVQQVDPEGYVTDTSYSIGSNVLNVKRYFNQASNLASVSASVKPTITADSRDAITSFTYDKIDRLKSSTDAEGGTESYTYDSLGNRTSMTNKLGGLTNYAYNLRGLLITETTAANSYDADGNSLAAQVVTTYGYDARGNLISKVEAANIAANARTTGYEYDKLDRLTKQIDPGFQAFTGAYAPTTAWQYDKRGNVTLQTAADGGKTYSYYDRNNRKIAEISPVGTQTVWSYDGNGNAINQKIYDTAAALPASIGDTPPAGLGAARETQFVYDRGNRLIQSTIINVRTGSFDGNSYVTAAGQNLKSYNQYDSAGNLIKESDANGSAIYHYYDKNGREIAKVDQERYLTTWSRDTNGNVLSETRFATRYDATPIAGGAPPTVSASADDRTTTFTYDNMGRRLTETRSGVTAYQVSETGSLSADSRAAQITYTYNKMGQAESKQEAAGTGTAEAEKTTYQYDSYGRLTAKLDPAITDQAGTEVYHRTQYYYDGLNNLVQSNEQAVDAAGDYASGYSADENRVTRYLFDGKMMTASISPIGMGNASDGQHNYSYDVMGRQTADYYIRLRSDGLFSPDSNAFFDSTSTSYDEAGRVTSQLQAVYDTYLAAWVADGPVTELTYNTFGEVTERRLGGTLVESFAYDNAGRLVKSNSGDGVRKIFVNDANGNATLTLASNGRDLDVTDAEALLTSDTIDNLLAATDLVGTINIYDKRNMATGTREPNRQLDTGANTSVLITRARAYNAFGEAISDTDAKGNTTVYAYNTMGRLTRSEAPTVSITNEDGTAQFVRPSTDYYYDLSGRLVGTRDANGSYATGGTDEAGTSKAADTGNLVTRSLLAGSGYGFSEAKVRIEFRPDGSVKQQAYDAFGDLRRDYVSRFVGETATYREMTYDKAGRLIESIAPSGLTDYYTYDILGQRLKHWNSFQGSGVLETTDYDIQGRVASTVDFMGHKTAYSYSWVTNTRTDSGLGQFGGWMKTTDYIDSGKSMQEISDEFGHLVWKKDLGGIVTTFAYDKAGRLANQTVAVTNADFPIAQNIVYAWYNTGKVRQITDNSANTNVGYYTSTVTSSFTYDANGNRLNSKYENTSHYYDFGYYGG